MAQKARLKKDVSIKMRNGDEVEIISEDEKIIDDRVGDLLNIGPDEVAIRKVNAGRNGARFEFQVCKKKYLQYL